MVDDQTDVIAFLEQLEPGAQKIIQTHAAIVALYPSEALKLKRAVKYDYLDFSTLDLRREMLQREIALNSRAAPGLYRDVVPITKDAQGRLSMNGTGEVVEWVLRMVRFSEEAELSVMADQGRVDTVIADALGQSIATYHREAPAIFEDGAVLIEEIIDELDRVLSGLANILEQSRTQALLKELRHALVQSASLMGERGRAGWVRRCHGDLHLRNIIMWNGVPTPFDALEFDERLGTCDVLYDLAFLLMDLEHRGLRDEANATLNAYLSSWARDDHLTGLAALPLFLAVRATIRAMVDAQTAGFQEDSTALIADAVGFMDQANAYLQPQQPALVAVGGLSGSGKTSLAVRVAAEIGRRPGAVHIRSDLERKALFRVDPLTRLPPSAYAPETNAKVYGIMRDKARHLLSAGHSVILDSVHGTVAERDEVGRIAADLGCQFYGFWLDLDTETRVQRVERRIDDASDADAAVARKQAAIETGPIEWIKLDAAKDLDTLARETLSIIAVNAARLRT